MPAEEIIQARLNGHGPLVAIVGARIHGGRAPQGTPAPFVQYRRISGADEHVLDGRTDIRNGRWQVDCYAATYEASIAVARAASAAVQDANDGDLHAEVEATIDLFEDDGPPKLFRRVVDFVTVERTI